MPSIFSRLGRTAAKLGRKIRPRTRHGAGHLRRKYFPNAGLITGGVLLGVGGDMLANEIAPEPEAPIFATGEINDFHTTEDKSFSLFHFNEED